MHRTLSSRWLSRALGIGVSSSSTPLSTYLCPALHRHVTGYVNHRPLQISTQRRRLHVEASLEDSTTPVSTPTPISASNVPARKLPMNCTGCGAFSQTQDPKHFGYYDLGHKRVKEWLQPKAPEVDVSPVRKRDEDVNDVLKSLDKKQLEALGIDPATLLSGVELPGQDVGSESQPAAEAGKPPICDRCHNLLHHGITATGTDVPMFHPTVDTLRETIEESPHKYNHIYHVIDAADFPMSLIPRLHVLLGDIPLRTRNRRSRAGKFTHDRKIELSFIITRADLLGPTKEKVDRMMPYLREVLRDAMGRLGDRIRLGNVRCVSAKRGWWTQKVREEIWKRGGAGWMIGKVNVGKSQLFEAVYPKGRLGSPKANKHEHSVAMYPREEEDHGPYADNMTEDDMDVGELLPPLQPARKYPDMPIVSALPGTTASPIRIPFGNKRGELIDLPGLERSDLDTFVKPEHRNSLLMKNRLIPEQRSVTSTRSLLLGGGLIRITPRTPNLTFLMYNFTPLDDHLTSSEKAIEFQGQSRATAAVENISLPEVAQKIKHAGTFKLRHDVTKRRAGPLVRKEAVGLNVENLPFRVLSIDILIEGLGYVEIVAQIRTKDLRRNTPPAELAIRDSSSLPEPLSTSQEKASGAEDENIDPVDPFAAMTSGRRDANGQLVDQPQMPSKPKPQTKPTPASDRLWWPEIDVYTPEGRFIGSRKPIEGWMNNKPLIKAEHKKKRPRRSMKGAKKAEKARRRAAAD